MAIDYLTTQGKLLEGIPLNRIDYIEDPFMNKSEFIQFTKSNNLKFILHLMKI